MFANLKLFPNMISNLNTLVAYIHWIVCNIKNLFKHVGFVNIYEVDLLFSAYKTVSNNNWLLKNVNFDQKLERDNFSNPSHTEKDLYKIGNVKISRYGLFVWLNAIYSLLKLLTIKFVETSDCKHDTCSIVSQINITELNVLLNICSKI